MKHNKLIKYSAVASSLLFALSANATTPEGFASHGYFMYGVGFSNDETLNDGAYNWAGTGGNILKIPGAQANSSVGRLGNDGNWLQFQGDYGINKNDMNWGVHAMYSTGGIDNGAKHLTAEWVYVDAVGAISSMPDATVWVGQKYVNRVTTPLVVNEALAADGRGLGIEKIDTDYGLLDLSLTRNLYNSYNSDEMRQGDYAVFGSALRGIDVADTINAELYFNYGTYIGGNHDEVATTVNNVDYTNKDTHPNAYQAGLKFNHDNGNFHHQLFLRYSKDSWQGITRDWSWNPRPSSMLGGFFYGKYQLTTPFRLEYTYAHETLNFDEEARRLSTSAGYSTADSLNWNSFIVRATYDWNQRTSTQLETGYESAALKSVTTGETDKNSAYKITLSQNLHIGSGEWDRPNINFYVTHASQDLEWGSTTLGTQDAMTYGVMFEAWW